MNPTVTYPLRVAAGTWTESSTSADVVIRQLIAELLFTTPGERLNRPTLGCNLEDLVFGVMTPELVAVAEFQVQSAIQDWLGTLLSVLSVSVAAVEAEAIVTVTYRPVDEAEWRSAEFRQWR